MAAAMKIELANVDIFIAWLEARPTTPWDCPHGAVVSALIAGVGVKMPMEQFYAIYGRVRSDFAYSWPDLLKRARRLRARLVLRDRLRHLFSRLSSRARSKA